MTAERRSALATRRGARPGARLRTIGVACAGSVAAAGLLAACGGTAAPGPTGTAQAYLTAWGHQDYAAMARLVSNPPKDFVSFNRSVASGLGLTAATYRLGAVAPNGSEATAAVR
ncbi:MAG TPA: hypothetical protein VHS57_07330, partial [Acidimicrobiales bacterium]|nr:hypothetical protein [Acidimicrobiales bacterium]